MDLHILVAHCYLLVGGAIGGDGFVNYVTYSRFGAVFGMVYSIAGHLVAEDFVSSYWLASWCSFKAAEAGLSN